RGHLEVESQAAIVLNDDISLPERRARRWRRAGFDREMQTRARGRRTLLFSPHRSGYRKDVLREPIRVRVLQRVVAEQAGLVLLAVHVRLVAFVIGPRRVGLRTRVHVLESPIVWAFGRRSDLAIP